MQNFRVATLLLAAIAYGCGRDSGSQLASVDVGTESRLEDGSCKIEFEANSPRKIRRWSVRVTDSIAIRNAWGQRMEPRKKAKKGDRITQESATSVVFDFKTAKKGDGYGVLVPYEGEITIEIDVMKRNGKKHFAGKRITMLAKDLPGSDIVLDEAELDWQPVKNPKKLKKLKKTASLRIYAACDKAAEPESQVPYETKMADGGEDPVDPEVASAPAEECTPRAFGQDVLLPVNCGYLDPEY